MSATDQEKELSFEEIDVEEKLLKLKSLSSFSFYFGIISFLLFSWFFQLILWGVLDVTKVALVVYILIVVLIPLGGLVCGIISRAIKKGLIGLILNSIIVLSYLSSTIVFLILSSMS